MNNEQSTKAAKVQEYSFVKMNDHRGFRVCRSRSCGSCIQEHAWQLSLK